jgi:hypothetical protein
MPPYQYSGLKRDEIRLLTLSSRSSGPLRISIDIKKLSALNKPRYEALSYAWGPKDGPCMVYVEGARKHGGLKSRPKTSKASSGASHSAKSHRVPKPLTTSAKIQPRVERLRSAVSIFVAANLAEALPYLQLENKKRVLWIDAICMYLDRS